MCLASRRSSSKLQDHVRDGEEGDQGTEDGHCAWLLRWPFAHPIFTHLPIAVFLSLSLASETRQSRNELFSFQHVERLSKGFHRKQQRRNAFLPFPSFRRRNGSTEIFGRSLLQAPKNKISRSAPLLLQCCFHHQLWRQKRKQAGKRQAKE